MLRNCTNYKINMCLESYKYFNIAEVESPLKTGEVKTRPKHKQCTLCYADDFGSYPKSR